MGIVTGNFSRPAKFSTIIADADLDIGARAILSTNLSFYEGSATYWYIRNRAKLSYQNLSASAVSGSSFLRSDIVAEKTAGNGILVDGLLIKDDKIAKLNGIGGCVIPKIVSDNLRNSHDAEVHDERADGSTWLLGKTFTLATGIKGILRFKLEAKGEHVSTNNKVIWAKNNKANDLGVEFVPENLTYQANSQDADVGTMAAGETIEVWSKAHDYQGIFFKNCRIYYNDEECTPETMTTS
jgi:hypothetical protein